MRSFTVVCPVSASSVGGAAQLPRLPAHADLVTCGIGVNDILYTGPGKLFADLRALIAAVPDQTVLLDLPVAEVSAHFLPPWAGKFASDCFHPSQDGYRDWSRALLAAVASTPVRSAPSKFDECGNLP